MREGVETSTLGKRVEGATGLLCANDKRHNDSKKSKAEQVGFAHSAGAEGDPFF